MKRLFLFLVCMSILTAAQLAALAKERLQVSVLDESNKGVISTIYDSSGISNSGAVRIGETANDGRLSADVSCAMGMQVWAQPADDVSYFYSEKSDCKSTLVLRVLHKSTPIGLSDGYIIKTLGSGTSGPYIFVSKIVVAKSTIEKQSLFPLGRQNVRCEVRLDPTVFTYVYKVGNNNVLVKAKESISSSKNENGLARERMIYNEPCHDVDQSVKPAVKLTKEYLGTIYNRAPIAVLNSNLDTLIKQTIQ